MNGYLTVEETAARYRVKPGAIHKLTMTRAIPHTRRAGFRRVLFNAAHLDRWDAGATLETVELPDGGRLVRPMGVDQWNS